MIAVALAVGAFAALVLTGPRLARWVQSLRARGAQATAAVLPPAFALTRPARLPITIMVDWGGFPDAHAAAAAADSIDWWDDDVSDDAASTESFAALELRDFVQYFTGVAMDSIRLSNARTLPPQGDVLVIASRSTPVESSWIRGLLGAQDRKAPPASRDGYRLDVARHGDRHVTLIEGRSRTGALYGTYAFLEAMGVHFDGLGQLGTIVPRTPVPWPDDAELSEAPAYETRGFWAWEDRGDSTFFRWMAHNRMNLWTTAQSGHGRLAQLGIQLASGGHMMEHELLDPASEYPYDHPGWTGDEGKPRDPYPAVARPVDTNRDGRLSYFEAHPEWYGLRDGKRRDDIVGETGTNFCTANVDAVHELAVNLIRKLATGSLEHADQVNLWALDNGTWCECDACRAIGGPTDRWLRVLARVHSELERARRAGTLKRRVLLIAPAFLETSTPPSQPLVPGDSLASCAIAYFPYFRCYAHALEDPACQEINQPLALQLESWTHVLAEHRPAIPLMIGEYYDVSWHKSLPLYFPHVMARDLADYYRLGARHFHYMHAPTRLWGTWTLDHHLLSKLLWNPRLDVDALIEAFVRRDHAGAPEQMAAFYQALERATSNITALQNSVGAISSGNDRLADPRAPVFPLRHFQLEASSPGPDSAPSLAAIGAAMAEARSQLDLAMSMTRATGQKLRLEEIERRFAYGEDVFKLYAAILWAIQFHRQNDAAHAREAFAAAEQSADRLRRVHDLVQVSASHANAGDGFQASQVSKIYDFLRQRYGGRTP